MAKVKPAVAPNNEGSETKITAAEMGAAMQTVAVKLRDAEIITHDGYQALMQESSKVKRGAVNTSWHFYIDRSLPLTFTQILDRDGEILCPRIIAAGIEVEQSQHKLPPFVSLDITIEIDRVDQTPISRWHVDWANKNGDDMQPGPLVHLQYGGHVRGHRNTDHPLSVPRWCHPPMEVMLICEVMAANFYPDEWETLRDDPSWCKAISVGQKLCYSAYLNKMSRGLSISSRTLLHSMWASEWRTEV